MIPRDISRLRPPYTIPPEYILCYNRNRSSFNHTAVLLSFYVGLLLMPSSLICKMSVYVVCVCPPEINFYFCFGKFLPIDRYSRIVLYFPCLGEKSNDFSWNFPVSFGTGIFLFAPGLIDAAMLRMYQVLLTLSWYRFIFPCVPYKYYYRLFAFTCQSLLIIFLIFFDYYFCMISKCL